MEFCGLGRGDRIGRFLRYLGLLDYFLVLGGYLLVYACRYRWLLKHRLHWDIVLCP